ncbi:Hypothetical predicted protein [Cloeon dipterum]|uniref:Uncharacterized protein n=1 Tax=Cloeon dipterum TaxID=197152 RepID=A0A8S1DNP2_9INSE|nr:Hypothetical predicted protein [Cloeon dipterum]
MSTWIDYHTQYLPSDPNITGFAVVIDWDFLEFYNAIYMARTFFEGYYVPGFAFNGVGYFVSKERQLFQAYVFQVLIEEEQIDIKDYSELANGMVADDVVDKSEQIKFGTFDIGGFRYCGMVDSQHTCHINFFGQKRSKREPEFDVIIIIG